MKKITFLIFNILIVFNLTAQEKMTLVDLEGNQAFSQTFQDADYICEGFLIFGEHDKDWKTKRGVYDIKNKKMTIPVSSDYAAMRYIENGQAVIQHREGFDYNFVKITDPNAEVSYPYHALYNAKTGQPIISFSAGYTDITPLYNGELRIAIKQKEEFCVFDKNGIKLFCKKGQSPKIKDGLIFYSVETTEKNSWGGYIDKEVVIDLNGKTVVDSNSPYDLGYSDFSEGLRKVKKGKQHGFMDKAGKIVIPCQYEDAYSFEFGISCVKKDGKYGFIDKNNQVVIPFQYEKSYHAMAQAANCMKVKNGESWKLTDFKGNSLSDENYIEVTPFSGTHLKVKNENNEWFILNNKGEVVIPLGGGLMLGDAKNGLVSYEIDNKAGIMTLDGEEVVAPIYDGISVDYSSDNWFITVGDRYGMIDKTGKVILEPQYDEINTNNSAGEFNNVSGDIFYIIEKDGKKGVYYNGKVLEPQFKSIYTANNGYLVVVK